MLELKNSFILIIISLFTASCKTEKNKIKEIITTDSQIIVKETNDIIESSIDNLIFDSSNEYINYILNFDEKNFSGMYLDLTGDEEFVTFSNKPEAHLNDAKMLLKSNITALKKEIVVLSMHNLSLENKLHFLEFVYLASKQEKLVLKNNLFFIIGGFEFESEPKIIYNYKNPELRKLLKEISNDSKTPSNYKIFISEILSGDAYRHFKKKGSLR